MIEYELQDVDLEYDEQESAREQFIYEQEQKLRDLEVAMQMQIEMKRELEQAKRKAEEEEYYVDRIVMLLMGKTFSRESYNRIRHALDCSLILDYPETDVWKRETMKAINKWKWNKDKQMYEEKEQDFIEEKEMEI
jgi:hypothetical protein